MKRHNIIWLCIAGFCVILVYSLIAVDYFLFPIKNKEKIVDYSNKNNIDCVLVASLIYAESKYDSNAVSNRGAIGLMQIMPDTAIWLAQIQNKEYKKEYLFDAEYNISLGTYYLRYLFDKFQDETVVLCAYNAGEGIVSSWLDNPNYSDDNKTLKQIPYSQTDAYVKKIHFASKIYKRKIGL